MVQVEVHLLRNLIFRVHDKQVNFLYSKSDDTTLHPDDYVNNFIVTGSTQLTSDTWYHIVVRNNDKITIYLNGQEDASETIVWSIRTNNLELVIGTQEKL